MPETDELPISARLLEREPPSEPCVMYQRWSELLFLHWPVSLESIASTLPPGLQVDSFAGKAWLGVVPFQMSGVRPRFLPALGHLSQFPELNLRTYVVDAQGRPGVWFYSLDTPRRLPNWIARKFFHLNYCLANISANGEGGARCFHAQREKDVHMEAKQAYTWSREGAPYEAIPGSLDFFLVERYRLFAYDYRQARLWTGRVEHTPYALQEAKLHSFSSRLFLLNGLEPPEGAPVSVLASAGVDVRIHAMSRVR